MPSLVLYALLFMLIPVSGWAQAAPSAHTFTLQPGWNLISFPVLPEGDRSPAAVFGAMVTPWKREAQDGLKVLFACKRGRQSSQDRADVDALYSRIGRLQVQVESLKKVGAESTGVRRAWIEPDHPELSVVAQCELLGLTRSQWVYYTAVPESVLNQALLRRMDEEYTAHPFYGSRRMTAVLRLAGYPVNRKQVIRLMMSWDCRRLT